MKATETPHYSHKQVTKLGEANTTDLCILKDCHSGIKHPSVERFHWFSAEATKLPVMLSYVMEEMKLSI
jgi:hypothetical protein